MRLPIRFPSLLVSALLLTPLIALPAQDIQRDFAAQRALRHQNPQWLAIQPVLPDPATATPDKLELVADVLRARRLPEDALEFYGFAMQRGGDPARLLNKLGITELELQHVARARLYFQEAVRKFRKDPEGWNNLGAVEHIDQRYRFAISDYAKAVKLNKKAAIYHANLGTAYFEMNDYESGGREFDRALKLDPKVLENAGNSGATARVLREGNRGKFTFEMAKLYAAAGDEEKMLHYLEVASESGYDIAGEMASCAVLVGYRKDPRVLTILKNQRALSHRGDSMASVGKVVPLTPAAVSR